MAADADMLPPRYRGSRLIGRGGMGEIYRATDEALGRDVAVKVLSAAYAQDGDVRERFKREALAAARLSGEQNAVTIFDVGEHRGRPFIVMEYVPGGSLADRLRAGRPPLADALGWLRCRVHVELPVGDHTFFVGEVVSAEVGSQDEALVYVRRGYSSACSRPSSSTSTASCSTPSRSGTRCAKRSRASAAAAGTSARRPT